MRLFIAIPINKELEEEIKAYQQLLKNLPLRPTPAENLHVTLVFLGETPQSEIPQIEQKIRNVIYGVTYGTYGGSTSVGSVGAGYPLIPERFEPGPDPRRPRLVWLTLEASRGLMGLQKQLARALKREEKREFTTHITIARKKFDAKLTPCQIPARKLDESSAFEVKEIYLMQSELERSGAKYKILKRFLLPHG